MGAFWKYTQMSPLLLTTFYVRQRHLMVIRGFAANAITWELRSPKAADDLRRILQAGTLLRIQ